MTLFFSPDIERLNLAGLRLLARTREGQSAIRSYFGEQTESMEELLRSSTEKHDTDKVVILLHGILGGTLVDQNRYLDDLLWLDAAQIIFGNALEKLALDEQDRDLHPRANIVPERPLRAAYDLLALEISVRARVRVERFAYDWRKNIDQAARLLRERILRLTGGDPERRVIIVGHSMGAVVTRRFTQLFPAEDKLIEQAIFIAPPLKGSFVPAEVFSAQHSIVKKIERLRPGIQGQLLTTMRSFSGLYHLLPHPTQFQCDPLYHFQQWPTGLLSEKKLADGLSFIRSFESITPLAQRTTIIMAANQLTPSRIEFSDAQVKIFSEERGDGTVPISSAWDPNVKAHYLSTGDHSSMQLNGAVRRGIVSLIESNGASAAPLDPIPDLASLRQTPFASSAPASDTNAIEARLRDNSYNTSDLLWLLRR